MSRNSKNAKLHKLARDISASRTKGQKGPAKTQKKHTKKNCWYKDRNAYYRRNEKGAVTKKSKEIKNDSE